MARRHMLSRCPSPGLPFDPETYLTDVRMFHQEGFGAVYLIDDDRKAIIETGTSWDASKILEAVKTFGLHPSDIDVLVVSHIHLDHAGGAGFLLSDMPRRGCMCTSADSSTSWTPRSSSRARTKP